MDSQTEKLFVERLSQSLTPGQTLLISTHRPALFSVCDRLIVLDNGKIVADGPREQVIAAAASVMQKIMTMHDNSVLDLAVPLQLGNVPAPRSFARFKTMTTLAAAVCIVVAVVLIALGPLHQWAAAEPVNRVVIRIPLDQLRQVEAMTVDDDAQIVTEGQDAQQRNAALPLTHDPLEQMRRFLISTADLRSQAIALKCLTQAVYYESAYEPIAGRRAVAQVVLNRMRHPAYPKSVCGVVYQGAERRTGCQFSFTCDGSLLRRPSARAWQEAESVARAALTGQVEASVGTATHYHADYVLPKWAFELGKIGQLGRHIFYRFSGGWGRSSAFSGGYSGVEVIPAVNFAALSDRLASEGMPGVQEFTSGLTVPPHVTDRHSAADVGGRLDVSKEWRLAIPDPVAASSRYQDAIAASVPTSKQAQVALANSVMGEASE